MTGPVPRRRRSVLVGVGVVALFLGILGVIALPEGFLPGPLGEAPGLFERVLHQHGRMAAFGLLYMEESGIPMPIPGDVFVMFIGHSLPDDRLTWGLLWLAVTACVLLGASNLYLIARRFGHRIIAGDVGRFLHLTPSRVRRAERWFERWGFWALVVGRHIPGCRVPITVAAGTFGVGYPTFAASVAISTATWSAFFLAVGFTVGDRVISFLQLHHNLYLLGAILLTSVVLGSLFLRLSGQRVVQGSAAGERSREGSQRGEGRVVGDA